MLLSSKCIISDGNWTRGIATWRWGRKLKCVYRDRPQWNDDLCMNVGLDVVIATLSAQFHYCMRIIFQVFHLLYGIIIGGETALMLSNQFYMYLSVHEILTVKWSGAKDPLWLYMP